MFSEKFREAASPPRLSARGTEQIKSASDRPVLRDQYDPIFNPEGFINIGLAQNTLERPTTMLRDIYNRKSQLVNRDLEYHDDVGTTYRFYLALARLLNSHFKPVVPVVPDHMTAFAGCSPAIENFARAIANERENPLDRDIILTVAPYYSGFKTFTAVNNITLTTFQLNGVPFGTPAEVDVLNTFYTKGLTPAQQARVKGVILCNPHNPIGQCYQRDTIIKYALWCERNNLHLVSDEIYALSVFPSEAIPNPVPFISALSIDFRKEGVEYPGRIHVIYGLSKDFNSSGFRIGALISQHNKDIIDSTSPDAWYSQIGTPPDVMCSGLLNDADLLSKFIKENQSSLEEAYEFATHWFKFHGIPHTNSNAAQFTILDLTFIWRDVNRYGPIVGFTSQTTLAQFEGIFRNFLKSKKVLIGAGTAFGLSPGLFRFTFSQRRDHLIVGLKRVEDALGWRHYPYPPGKRIIEWLSDKFCGL